MRPTFDLQSHSIHSDGALPASDVVAHAAQAGVQLLALTDHDTIDGVPEAEAAARAHGIAITPAAELSAVHGEYEDLHILGYELDIGDADLTASLHDFRGDRARRIEEMADRLRELGFALDDAPLRARYAVRRLPCLRCLVGVSTPSQNVLVRDRTPLAATLLYAGADS